ncbi:MAG: peptidylprolyl isomerase [Candidatus Paceibacteria bacterium]
MKQYIPLASLVVFCLILVGGLSYWAGTTPDNGRTSDTDRNQLTAPLTPEEYEIYEPVIQNDMNPVVVLETNRGTIEIELYKDLMPVTAGNFEQLVSEGFYDGIQFHRVINGFMIQGGDPNTKGPNALLYGTGGPGYSIQDEHIANELLSNVRGTISMANSGPNSGGSQFFINLGDNSSLDFNDMRQPQSKHPVFGRVIKGMDVVDAIAVTDTNERDLPVEAVVIEKAAIKVQE